MRPMDRSDRMPGAVRLWFAWAVLLLAVTGLLLGRIVEFVDFSERAPFSLLGIFMMAEVAAVLFGITVVMQRKRIGHRFAIGIAALAGAGAIVASAWNGSPTGLWRDIALIFMLLLSMLAYSLFTIGSLHVLLMALLERRLHHGSLPRPLQGLPPLLAMETLLFRIIWAGFLLLTLTLATGVIYSEELFGKAARFNHKTVFGVLSWLIFAALLGGRHIYGWRGRVAVRWTLAGFLMLVLAYIGSKFVIEVILGR